MRPCLSVLTLLCLALAPAPGEDLGALPPLPPEPRPLQLAAPSGDRAPKAALQDRAGLADDLHALRRAVERVETALRLEKDPLHVGADPSHPQTSAHEAHAAASEPDAGPGTEVVSDRFGADRLIARTWSDGRCIITAAIQDEPAEAVVREIAHLAGATLDTRAAGSLRRPISVNVRETPWTEVLDRCLGQLGLTWSAEGGGHDPANRRLLVNETATEDSTRAEIAALTAAAADGTGPVAAEAAWRLAKREQDGGRSTAAMRSFNDLIEHFGDDRDRMVRSWVQMSVRGLAECMADLKQLREARSVYRNYISRAAPDDQELPTVYLRAAEIGRRLGLERNDPVAFDEAIEDLHTLLERFGGEDAHTTPPPEVAQARMMIGGLLFDARRWQEAETHLLRYQQAAGGRAADQVDAWLAECALQLKRPDDALPRFERLHVAWLEGKGDGLTPAKVYIDAAYRSGLCHLHATKPRYVEALFAFQRAAHDFPSAALDPEVLVAMAACYAQIEQEGNAVDTLLGMLKADTGPDGRGGRLALDSMVGDLMSRLAEHPGPVRARAYFYIAQATYRRAERERAERTTIAAQAVGYYDRVLGENPPPELKAAAQLGLARAAFLAGNDDRGLGILRGLRTDSQTLPRDREFANRLLGDWFRAQGKNREAVRAFRGETEGL